MPLREDDVAPRTGVPDRRTLLQAGGFALAIAATLGVFLTDDPQFLRLAVVAVAWAFVLATFAAGRRSADRAAARVRETELRRAYEFQLEREVAARREYELELEADLRREAEESMRAELDTLREDLAGLTGLRTDIAALSSLRQEIGQLAELRADMGRLRAELTEQLSSEMLIERIVMRTQAGRALDAAPSWTDEVPPRELTGGWPAVRLDEPGATRQFEQVRANRTTPRPPVPPVPPALPALAPSSPPSWRPSWESEPVRRPWETLSASPAPEDRWWASPPAAHSQGEETPMWSATAEDGTAGQSAPDPAAEAGPPTTAFPIAPSPVPEPLPSPAEWLAARSLVDAEPTSFRPDVPPRRRRGDDALADPGPRDPAGAATTQRPAVPAHPPIRVDDRGSYRVAVREEPPAEPPGPPAQEKRLADILAENGVSLATGGRRRRRYRDEDEADDVLARVLGNG
jgi:uncharacterized protein DUF6779